MPEALNSRQKLNFKVLARVPELVWHHQINFLKPQVNQKVEQAMLVLVQTEQVVVIKSSFEVKVAVKQICSKAK